MPADCGGRDAGHSHEEGKSGVDRREMALKFINLGGRGLEIGPSYNPLVTKASGARIETVDHADRATLVAKYQAWGLHKDKTDAIETVDHIWAGGSLLDVISERGVYDYIVASHFLEHTVDMVAFLADCEALLTSDGRLALALPDKRYCFDRFQPLSTIGDVVDAFHGSHAYHTAGTLLDHQAYACKRGDGIAWDPASIGPLSLQFPNLEDGGTVITAGIAQDEYHDIHHWKFTPTSFELLMRDLATLGFHTFGPVGAFGTTGFEFFITLAKGTPWPDVDRLSLLLTIENELKAPTGAAIDSTSVTQTSSLRQQIAELRAQLAAIRASRSWRTTTPVRRTRQALQRIRR
jgi:hypothetical protein